MLVEDGEFDIVGINQIANAPDSNFKILVDAQNDEEALDNLKKIAGIDLVIMDYRLIGSELNGVALTKKIIELSPKIKVLFCSISKNELVIGNAKKVGARGYICKHQPERNIREVIKSTIDLIMRGYLVWPPQHQMPRFTPTEKQVMYLLYGGCANYRDIAFQLLKIDLDGETDKITLEMLEAKRVSVEQHARNIMRKLGIKNINELTRWIVDDIAQAACKLPPNDGLPFDGVKQILPFTGILVIDDDRLEVLNLFDSLLDNEKDYRIMAQVESGTQALDLLENREKVESDELARYLLQDGKVQLVIVNSHRSDDAMNDVELAEKLGKEYPQVKVLFYGPETDVETVEKVKSVAASGYIWGKEYRSINQHIDHQDKRARDLKKAIKEIMIGRKVFRCNPPLRSV